MVKPCAFGVSVVSTLEVAATWGLGGAAVARTSRATRRLGAGAAVRTAPAGKGSTNSSNSKSRCVTEAAAYAAVHGPINE
jgi:hypothetical protein